nr:hypothetical protein OG461_34040 [Streptomyces sp. NBC_00995]
MAALAVVRDLREHCAPASAEELERFETDALFGFVLARASAGLTDGTIRGDVGHLDQIRTWFGRPLWDMEPADALDESVRFAGEYARSPRPSSMPGGSWSRTLWQGVVHREHERGTDVMASG